MGRPREVTANRAAIKWHRTRLEWSQKELAFRASEHLPEGESISLTLVAFIELGERQPSRRNLEAMAAAMGVPPELLAVSHDTADDHKESFWLFFPCAAEVKAA